MDPDGDIYGVLGIYDDISARLRAEDALCRVSKALRTLASGNESHVRALDENDLLQRMVRTIVEVGCYRMAWVGFALDDDTKSIRVVASHSETLHHPEAIRRTWGEDDHGQSPAGRAIRTGQTQLVRNVAVEPQLVPWSEAYSSAGCVSVLALPLLGGSGPFGVLNIYSDDPLAFKEDEVPLLELLAADLSYGIKSLRIEEQRRQANEALRRNLQETFGVIAATVESRDPYTAGHQKRVAHLAKAIAQEMGLTADEVEGIGFCALIHDLGNMQVPAGILARPARLSKAEFELIKTHPLIGFEILKDLHVPWPVATFILQHHERLDGSGYPQGLKGDDITLGARVIAVADVMEAMLSHRPYRPKLPLDEALNEIVQNRGQKYDPAVVDACVALWCTGRFSFEND